MKLSAAEAHLQLHSQELLPHEEIVHVTSSKGDPATFKLNHALKQVLVPGGPEEDCAFKHSNASYEQLMQRLGRAPEEAFFGVGAKPVDLASAAPPEPVLSLPE